MPQKIVYLRFCEPMAAVHRLSADLFEDSFDLIGIHSRLEGYALAYSLNLNLKTRFERRRKDLEISSHITIPVFEWKDDSNERYWTLFANNGTMSEKSVLDGLFENEPAFSSFHLVPEHRKAEYFLKIEQESPIAYRKAKSEKLVQLLLDIPQVLLAFHVETDKLKSKSNLIF